jgi:ArsR family transcriptional regulator
MYPASLRDMSSSCCEPLASQSLTSAGADDLAGAFKALADPVRLRLLNLILTSADGEVCACDLIVPVGRSQPTVSHHLRLLREAGLVHAQKRQTNVWYSVQPDRLAMLRDALAPSAVAAG